MYESDYDGNSPTLVALMDLIFCVDIIYQPVATDIRGPHYVVNYSVLISQKNIVGQTMGLPMVSYTLHWPTTFSIISAHIISHMHKMKLEKINEWMGVGAWVQ